MIDPHDSDWLRALVDRSVLVPEPTLRRHWHQLIPHLTTSQRYELAAVLLETERRLSPSG
jgi:hypothetical protein